MDYVEGLELIGKNVTVGFELHKSAIDIHSFVVHPERVDGCRINHQLT